MLGLERSLLVGQTLLLGKDFGVGSHGAAHSVGFAVVASVVVVMVFGFVRGSKAAHQNCTKESGDVLGSGDLSAGNLESVLYSCRWDFLLNEANWRSSETFLLLQRRQLGLRFAFPISVLHRDFGDSYFRFLLMFHMRGRFENWISLTMLST